ncbi:hypothetical protein BGX34_000642 [Mortierella sp. NVP85]|nr:hypothetical protein BGX34_000642 [Mortierella sp. NVP85]
MTKGTWSSVAQAAATGSSGGKGRQQGSGTNTAGRTMVGFAIGGIQKSQGVVIGGGWLPAKTNTRSAQATELISLVTEADLISFRNGGSLESLMWAVAQNGGNGGGSLNDNLGSVAGAKVVPLSNGMAVVLGGVTNGQRRAGMSFTNLPIVDMMSGTAYLQRTTSAILGGIAPRYGHCAALAVDGSTIIMYGGSTVSNDKVTNDLYLLDTRTWTWTQPTLRSTSLLPPPVRDHQCVVIGDQFLTLFGFNSNQAPASGGPSGSSSSPIPSAPPIYILSTSQWAWTTQFRPTPGTPSPPTPPDVPTDDKKGKINGVGIAFGVIFGLAFLAVIVYGVFSHKQKQKRKAETLKLLEMQQKQKEDAKLEKEREQRKDAPLPPTPPMAHTQAGGYQGQDFNGYHNNSPVYPPPGSSNSSHHYQGQNPFQNPNYHQNQHGYSNTNPYPNYNTQQAPPMHQNSSGYVPEEMGYTSPAISRAHQGYGDPSGHSKVPLEYE